MLLVNNVSHCSLYHFSKKHNSLVGISIRLSQREQTADLASLERNLHFDPLSYRGMPTWPFLSCSGIWCHHLEPLPTAVQVQQEFY